jgi:uncharacterized protein
MTWCSRSGDVVTLELKVFPKSPHSRIGPVEGGRLQVRIHAAPEDGEANAAVVALLARAFEVPRGAVAILVGQTSRLKTVRITGSSVEPVAFERGSVDVKSK